MIATVIEPFDPEEADFCEQSDDKFRLMKRMIQLLARWCATGAILFASGSARSEDVSWKQAGAGLAVSIVTYPGPVVYTTVRVELSRLNKDLFLTTTLASNTVIGLETLTGQIRALPKELGTPVAAINGDFFMMDGAAKGDPRGLQILRGELVSTPAGPAAFWQDANGGLHGEPVVSRLTVTWLNGGTHLAGLNEQHGSNSIVLFTPRMGRVGEDRANSRVASSPRRDGPPRGGPIRKPGGREWTLEYSGFGPWLPLRLGQSYQARVRGSFDGFTNVPAGMMVLSLGSNLVASLPSITNGTPVAITAATEPDLSGVQTALGSGPMLVREGSPQPVTARTSDQLQPRSALGWNGQYLYLAVADGRQPELSVGIRLSEMAAFLVELGCQEAIDLDGGQSTVLMLNGAIINHPVQGRDRQIANAIVVLRRARAEEEKVDE
jgi:Phosphodiester glycosidase